MIPPLDERGFLPPGVHESDWDNVVSRLSDDPRRRVLLEKLQKCLNVEFRDKFASYPLVIAGSCWSDKPYPNDIEITIVFRGAPREIQAEAVLHHQENKHRLEVEYEVDYYPTIGGLNDFETFFQYVGPKSALAKGLKPDDKRGVVKVKKW